MPVPGPRTQFGARPGYANPQRRTPGTQFNRWHRPPPVAMMGHSPGLTYIQTRGHVQATGQIRRMYRQMVNFIPAPAPYSWTANGQPLTRLQGVAITRALRYMTRSVYMGSGIDQTKLSGLHTRIVRGNDKGANQVTIGRGQTRSRPTTRNRMASFGSRVPVLNPAVVAATNQPGQGT